MKNVTLVDEGIKVCPNGHTYAIDHDRCPECQSIYRRAYYLRNGERIRAKQHAWYAANADRVSARAKTASVREQTVRTQLRRRFGITLEYVWALQGAQNGKCACCFRQLKPHNSALFYLGVIDHDHTTGRVRALLCNLCSVKLKHYENPDPRFLNYLEAH